LTWAFIAWLCEPHVAFLLPSTWSLPAQLSGLAALPKIVPILGAFCLLVKDGILPALDHRPIRMPSSAATSKAAP
jgi:hypothetical protein